MVPTVSPTALPLTVQDWLHAYAGGAEPRPMLARCLARARAESPDAVWIHLADDAELEAQLRQLEQWASVCADRVTLLAQRPLFGVPFAVKDNIDIAGVATTDACPAFSRPAARSALVIEKLQAAGAVWLGKTNLDQFATGLVGTRSPYGRPASVFSSEHISGGSSSGSAVALAWGLVAFALGTDTAGSGRVPAAFNQLVGLKPTPGRVGASGVVPACRTLDCVSVFAFSAAEAAHVLALVEGPDADDAYSNFAPGPAAFPATLRVGIPREPHFSVFGAGEGAIGGGVDYTLCWDEAVERARAMGHELVPLDFTPLHRIAELLYTGPWIAERYAVIEALLKDHPEALEPSVRAIISGAQRYSAADAFRGQYRLKSLAHEARALWREADVLLMPTTPGHPRFGDVAAEPLTINATLGHYTNFVNLLGWCALALPSGTAGFNNVPLPFGITFVAPGGCDTALASVGAAWQACTDLPLGATGARLATHADVPLRSPAARASLKLAVVGAHLSGMPLNGQLRERGARLLTATRTAPRYRLFALPGTVPPKPGLMRAPTGAPGSAIEVEVWDMPMEQAGSFLALVPPPLGLGSLELVDGSWVHGFICEGHAADGAKDISHHGGWRAYIRSLQP
jgi:allophanate hydrolase